MTAARCAHLARLLQDPRTPRERGPCGYHCMRLGWTEWLYVDGVIVGEYVTEAGQLALARRRGQIT